MNADASPPSSDIQSADAVVFDFDHTLYAGDSGQQFVTWLLKHSRWRTCLALLAAPVCAPLIAWLPTRRRGISAFVWIATTGTSDTLAHLVQRYLKHHANLLRQRLLPEALAVLRQHQHAGDRVLIATGAPPALARRILALAGIGDIPVLGTALTAWYGGLVVSRHCHAREKLRMLHEHGCTAIAAAYSDSSADLPLLQAAREPVVVNPKPSAIPRFRRTLPAGTRILDWGARTNH